MPSLERVSRFQVRPWSPADLTPVNELRNHFVRTASSTLVLERADRHRARALAGHPNSASVPSHLEFGFRLVGQFTEPGRGSGRFWGCNLA